MEWLYKKLKYYKTVIVYSSTHTHTHIYIYIYMCVYMCMLEICTHYIHNLPTNIIDKNI